MARRHRKRCSKQCKSKLPWCIGLHWSERPSSKSLQVWRTGFADSSVGQESACNAWDPGLIPGCGRSPGEGIGSLLQYSWASVVAQMVKNPPVLWETWVRSPEKGKAPHCSILAMHLMSSALSDGFFATRDPWEFLAKTWKQPKHPRQTDGKRTCGRQWIMAQP